MVAFKPIAQGISNIILFALVILTVVFSLVTIYDGKRDAASLDVGLSGVSARADPIAAAMFADGGALAGDADAKAAWDGNNDDGMNAKSQTAVTAGYANAQAVVDAVKPILKARIKLQYALKESPLVWQGEAAANGKRGALNEPKNSIDFQFDRLNDGWTACKSEVATVFSPFDSLSPAGADLDDRCADDDRIYGDGENGCDQSWIATLYNPDTTPLGVTISYRWSEKTCKFQKDAWPYTAASVIVATVLQFIYYAYWGMFTGCGTNIPPEDTFEGRPKTVMKTVSSLTLVFLICAVGLFSASHHHFHNEKYENGLQDPTTVAFDNDVEVAHFPARAQMYSDAFKMCYPSYTDAIPAASSTPTITNGCAAWATFQEAMDDSTLDLASASNCAFGDAKDTYETPIDACNLPDTFADYSLKPDGPQLQIQDNRGSKIEGTQRTIPVISINIATKVNYGLILAGLTLWTIKTLLVVLDVFDITSSFLPCIGGDKYAIAGGYAGAV